MVKPSKEYVNYLIEILINRLKKTFFKGNRYKVNREAYVNNYHLA